MKFRQLIEHNMGNIFLQQSYTKSGGDTFLKNQKWAYLRINSFYFLFLLYAKLKTIKIY